MNFAFGAGLFLIAGMSNGKQRLGRGLSGILKGGAPAGGGDPKTVEGSVRRVVPAKPKDGGAVARRDLPMAPGYREIPVEQVEPSPYQPRRDIRAEAVAELAESIRAEGLLQPIVVRAVGETFQLIAGERRWRAFQTLGVAMIPARIIEASDASSASLALIENLQREQLNPIEEALGYASLIRDFDLTQEAAAERVGKSRSVVANALRLLGLSREIQGYVTTGRLSVGHAKVLLGVEDETQRLMLARRIVEVGMSVREAEVLVRSHRKPGGNPGDGVGSSGQDGGAAATALLDLQRRLEQRFHAPVAIKHGAKKGRIVIEYSGEDDLNRIVEMWLQ